MPRTWLGTMANINFIDAIKLGMSNNDKVDFDLGGVGKQMHASFCIVTAFER